MRCHVVRLYYQSVTQTKRLS